MRRPSLRRSNHPFGSASTRNRLIRRSAACRCIRASRPVSLPTISPLRGLVEVTRLLRAREDLPALLDAVARTIGESLGYRTVAVNLYRPEWDDFEVTTVYGNEEARTVLLGNARPGDDWTVLLSDRFERRGAYVVPSGRSTGTRSGRATCRREAGRAIPTPGIPRTRSSSRCATSAASCSGSSRWTSRSAAAGRRTTTSRCSSRSSTMRRSPSRRCARRPSRRATSARSRSCSPSRLGSPASRRTPRSCAGCAPASATRSTSATSARRSSTRRPARSCPQATAGWQLEEMRPREPVTARPGRAAARRDVPAGGLLPPHARPGAGAARERGRRLPVAAQRQRARGRGTGTG